MKTGFVDSAPNASDAAGSSGPSHWFSDTGPAGPVSATKLPGVAEVVVVGGGIIGVAATYWLAKVGVDVVLVEASRPGWGASGRNAGLMLCGGSPLEDPDLIRGVLLAECIDAEFLEIGHLALASSDQIVEKIQREVAQRPKSGPTLRWLEHLECEDILGLRLNDRYLGARWLPSGRSVHPVKFLYGLANAAFRNGATNIYDTAVLKLASPRSSLDSVDVITTRGRVRARHVVLACNVKTTTLLPGLQQVLTAVRGQVVSTSPLPPIFRHGMAVDWGTLYWRQASDGAIVLGGYHSLDPHTEETAQEGLNGKIQSALLRFLPEAFPEFPTFTIGRRWSGIMDQTADGKPIVGQWEGNIWITAGFGGHGFPPALGAGKAIAEAIRGGEVARELDALNPRRFRDRLSRRAVSLPRESSNVTRVREA